MSSAEHPVCEGKQDLLGPVRSREQKDKLGVDRCDRGTEDGTGEEVDPDRRETFGAGSGGVWMDGRHLNVGLALEVIGGERVEDLVDGGRDRGVVGGTREKEGRRADKVYEARARGRLQLLQRVSSGNGSVPVAQGLSVLAEVLLQVASHGEAHATRSNLARDEGMVGGSKSQDGRSLAAFRDQQGSPVKRYDAPIRLRY